jgi:periplasmic protein TonB
LSHINPNWSAPVTPPPKVTLPSGESSPRLTGVTKPISQGFISNLKDFLTEKPIKVAKDAKGSLGEDHFGDSFTDNLKDWFKPGPRIPRNAPASRMEVAWQSPYAILVQNIRDLISPPKLPPLKVTSKPVKVKDIWSKDEVYRPSQALAICAHLLLLGLILVPVIKKVTPPVVIAGPVTDLIDISPYAAKLPPGKDKAGGGGGGGDRNPVPATKGRAPKFSLTQIAPPLAVIRNQHPILQAPATLLGDPDLKLPSPDLNNFGDPLAKLLTNSGGSGGGSGIGDGTGTGNGNGDGGGLGDGHGGGTGGGYYHPGTGGVGYPTCEYCPQPKYSEEARKAKYQGTVVLQAVIQPDGHATDIQVVKGPGLGLDDKAVEAVKQWRFKPAIGPNGKPVPVVVPIEVTFRLL